MDFKKYITHTFMIIIIIVIALALIEELSVSFPKTNNIADSSGASVLLPFGKNNKYGYYSADSNVIISTQFLYATHFSGNWAYVEIRDIVFNNKNLVAWRGAALRKDGILFKYPRLSLIDSFNEGLARASKTITSGRISISNSLVGFINENGEWVIEAKYQHAFPFSEGLAAVAERNMSWGFIDKQGNHIFCPCYSEARSFSEGKAIIKHDDKNGVLFRNGNCVLLDNVRRIRDFKEGYAIAEIVQNSPEEAMVCILNDKAEICARLKDVKFEDNCQFGNELAPVKNTENLWGYINSKGEWAIVPQFVYASSFHEGKAGVCEIAQNGERVCGFIKPDGSYLIEPVYQGVGDFVNGFAPIEYVLDGPGERYVVLEKHIDINGHIIAHHL